MRITIDRNVEISMRDGVITRADVYLPQTHTRLPALLSRTPYGKGFEAPQFALMAAERGYAVVVQDTRGRWASEGEGDPFVHEQRDGYDTLAWLGQQAWCDGNIGMFGLSYVGYTQIAAAVNQYPGLKAIAPVQTFSRPSEFVYAGGAFALGSTVSWGLMAGASMAIQRIQESGGDVEELIEEFIWTVDGMTRGDTFSSLPLADLPLVGANSLVPYVGDTLSHPPGADYWKGIDCRASAIHVPAFHIAGWYDIFIRNTIDNYTRLKSGSVEVPQRLLIGPWTHGKYESLVGDVDFGVGSSWMFVLPEEEQLRWFDYWLKGEQNGVLDEPPVRIFIMGINRWRSEDAWPLQRAVDTPFYLHSEGSANASIGDGSLSTAIPGEQQPDTFVYDPNDPVPTRGGNQCCYQPALRSGAFDQRQVESRQDVLVYTSPVLDSDLEVTGDVCVRLWAATTATDTDFTVKLVDVSPDGYARNVCDGIVRAGHVAVVKPGELISLEIELGPTSNVFLAGHRIRLEISSSNFPRFARNPNTGVPYGQATELLSARQTIFHDNQRPSHLLLPVVTVAT